MDIIDSISTASASKEFTKEEDEVAKRMLEEIASSKSEGPGDLQPGPKIPPVDLKSTPHQSPPRHAQPGGCMQGMRPRGLTSYMHMYPAAPDDNQRLMMQETLNTISSRHDALFHQPLPALDKQGQVPRGPRPPLYVDTFYTIPEELEDIIQRGASDNNPGLKEQIIIWMSDDWACLMNPPEWLSVAHFLLYMPSYIPQDTKMIKANRAHNHLTMARLTSDQNSLASITSYLENGGLKIITEGSLSAAIMALSSKLTSNMIMLSNVSSQLANAEAQIHHSVNQASIVMEGIQTDTHKESSAVLQQIGVLAERMSGLTGANIGSVVVGAGRTASVGNYSGSSASSRDKAPEPRSRYTSQGGMDEY